MTTESEPLFESLSAVTLVTSDMGRALRFYKALGFPMKYGGPDKAFTSFEIGSSSLNLVVQPHGRVDGWGRVIIYVSDVDALYRKIVAAGIKPAFAPSDATWGERYFHLNDPDGHELSFARPLG